MNYGSEDTKVTGSSNFGYGRIRFRFLEEPLTSGFG
jgi:hypothetical protein